MKTISIIIPVYNEEKFIQKTIEKVLTADTLRLEKEIIIIDDYSTDNTVLQVKKSIKSKGIYINIRLIEKKQNEGKGSALKIGFLKSKGDIVLVQDADLEYSPDDYPILLEPFIKQNADVVYGSRFISNRPHRVLYFWHSVINNFLTMLSNVFTNLNLTDMETGFKVFRGALIRKIARQLESKQFGFEPEITARVAKIKTLKIYEVGISYQGRTYEEGKKIGWKDGARALWEIVKYNLFTS
jgi:glycosyltransferase involved in cell wall biosynthesis